MWSLITGLFFPEKQQEWRKSVSFLLCIFGGLSVANTWLMWGLFPVSLFFSGFATAQSVQETQKAIEQTNKSVEKVERSVQAQSSQMSRDKNELKAALLLSQLNQIFDAMCGALRNRRTAEADQWEKQFTETIIEYNMLTGQVYPMRNCG
jgi:hypothetical protein